MHPYCLFVETTKEHLIKTALEQIIPQATAIVPFYLYHFYTSSGFLDVRKVLLPGYVFLFVPTPLEPSLILSSRPLGLLKILKGGGTRKEKEIVERWRQVGVMNYVEAIERLLISCGNTKGTFRRRMWL